MSTTDLQACLDYCADMDLDRATRRNAKAELDAIRKAASVIHAAETGQEHSHAELMEAHALMGRIAQEAER